MSWKLGAGRSLSLDEPRLMGILNITPDSFSDGGRHMTLAAAVGAAMRMIEEGACMIDVGGESTRPGATPVSAQQQIDRVVPVICQLRSASDIAISVDTTLSSVAAAALDAGAEIVNDVSAGGDDEAMFPLVAQRGGGLVIMHRRVRPQQDHYSDEYSQPPEYGDVVAQVREFLLQRAAAAETAGVAAASIVVDPGLGFGKSVQQNFQLIARIGEIAGAGYPVLAAASRKSFIGAMTGVEVPRDRVAGSVAVAVELFRRGVHLFRVHDVEAHRQALAAARAIELADSAPAASPADRCACRAIVLG
jgi:dihydropteroate synthase